LEIVKQGLRTPYIGAQRAQLFDDSLLMHHSPIESCHSLFCLFQQIGNDLRSHTTFSLGAPVLVNLRCDRVQFSNGTGPFGKSPFAHPIAKT
jgi:hypothetical protein